MSLTGRSRYRVGFRGKIILQVEDEWRGIPPHSRHICTEHRWRDASPEDFLSGAITTEFAAKNISTSR